MPGENATNAAHGRALIAELRKAALATLKPDGGPFASHVTTAPADDGSPLLLLSRLAVHTRNLLHDPRASLLLVRQAEEGSEVMTAVRLTLTGRVGRDDDPRSRSLFLEQVPEAARYADFPDFSLYRFRIESGHLVAGFGRIVDLAPEELLPY